MKTAAMIALVIGLVSVAPLRAEPDELLKPSDKKEATGFHQITYKLSKGSENWDADPKGKIVKAMDEAVAIYNKNGDFQRVLTANWNPGTPTADANFGGWINFGGQIGTRTALHEIAHTLGIGTAPNWGKYAVNGKWTGQYGLAQLREFDGPDAVLHCDRQHFWPYGLNYDTEGGPENFKRNVMMVTAMRADMGLGPPPHPATAALKAALANAADAHEQVTQAEQKVSQAQVKLRSGLGSRPEVIQASRSAAAAKSAYDSTIADELKILRQSDKYQALKTNADASRKTLDALQADSSSKPEDREAAAQVMLNARGALSQFENKDLSSAPKVVAAKSAYHDAILALGAAQKAPLENDPELVEDKKALAEATTKSTAADQAVNAAEQAASKEKK
jgi:hypothetical protein